MPKIQALRGMNDILPEDTATWFALEKIIFDLLISHGYKNIRTPIVEKTATFLKAIGTNTDVTTKEMYSWQDLSGKDVSLRPEGTAGCVRAVIEHNIVRNGIQKLFYQGQMFRYERPQKGRYRQFHQLGVEIFGVNNIKADAELIAISNLLWQKIGLKNINLEINTLGSNEARANYKTVLLDYFISNKNKLDEDSIKRLSTNPLRILDSKNKDMSDLINNAPKLVEYLDDKSRQLFAEFKKYLDYLSIPYKINYYLVRGLDYYNGNVFEWTTSELGSQNAVCAGGRYDNLVEKMGGKPTCAIGFAIGLERLILLLEKQKINITNKALVIYIIALGEAAELKSMQICSYLYEMLPKIILYNDTTRSNLKNQLKKANKIQANYALILGEEELNVNQVSIKPLKSQNAQQMMSLQQLIHYFKNKT